MSIETKLQENFFYKGREGEKKVEDASAAQSDQNEIHLTCTIII